MNRSCQVDNDCEQLEPFLSHLDVSSSKHNWYRKSISFCCQSTWRQKLFAHFTLILVYTFAFAFVLAGTLQRGDEALTSDLPLFARGALQQEIRPFETRLRDNPFTGPPRPELEAAWHKLLQHNAIQIPSESLRHLDVESIRLIGGSTSIASLSVYHGLHCLKKIRQWIHKDHYYPEADSSKIVFESTHVDHCIEYIRESLMCKPDISPVTFAWINGTSGDGPLAPTNTDVAMHECVNWAKLDEWTGEHVFDLYRLDLLQKPV